MKCLCMCICWVYLYEYIWRGTARRTFVHKYVFCVCLVVLLDLFLARWNVCACVYAVYTSAFMLWVCEYIIKGMARTTNLFVYSVRRTARRTYLYIYIYIYVSHMYTVYVWWCPFWLVVGAMKCLRMCVYMLWILIGICWFFFSNVIRAMKCLRMCICCEYIWVFVGLFRLVVGNAIYQYQHMFNTYVRLYMLVQDTQMCGLVLSCHCRWNVWACAYV